MAQSTVIVPAFSASAVEQICRVLADAVTGSQIPNLIAPLKVPESPGDEQNTKWMRLFNAVAARQNQQQDGKPLLRLVSEVMAPVRFRSQAEFEATRGPGQRAAAVVWVPGPGRRQGCPGPGGGDAR